MESVKDLEEVEDVFIKVEIFSLYSQRTLAEDLRTRVHFSQ